MSKDKTAARHRRKVTKLVKILEHKDIVITNLEKQLESANKFIKEQQDEQDLRGTEGSPIGSGLGTTHGGDNSGEGGSESESDSST